MAVVAVQPKRYQEIKKCWANNVGSCGVRVGSGLQTGATTPNNVGICSVGGLQPIRCNSRAWPQQCWKCKRIQRCCATLRRSRNGRNVGSCWFKGLTGFKLCATTPNNMQQGVQTTGTCNIKKCWKLLANNVASVYMGLDSYDCYCFF